MLLVVIFMSDIVLFSKLDRFSQAAGQIARTALGDDVLVVTGRAGDPLPEAVGALKASVILSFLSPWILPKSLLRRARIALNWHPASSCCWTCPAGWPISWPPANSTSP